MMVAEVLASTDLDVACFDAEHSPFDRRDIDSCLLAFRSAQKPALVRVASSSADQILNALDCGATGVVIPHVDSPEKALACVGGQDGDTQVPLVRRVMAQPALLTISVSIIQRPR
jgi:2-keto-3-deoxy-L-rhamnonate aldolase RhmA